MIKRIIDRDGVYFPGYGEPTGHGFCRLMSRIAIRPTDKLYDISPESIVVMTTNDNGYMGKVDSYAYNHSADVYEFHVVDFNSERYAAFVEYYLFLGMKVFRVQTIAENILTVDTVVSTDFYDLMRSSEEKGILVEDGVIDGSIWGVSFSGQLPEIEYRCDWNTYSIKKDKIKDKEFSSLDVKVRKKSGESKKTNWRVLSNTTGIVASARSNKFQIIPFTGIAMTDVPSVYSPRSIEFDIYSDNAGVPGVKLFKIRLFFEIYGIYFNQLSRFRTSSYQVWSSQLSGIYSYPTASPSRFDREGYYDGEDFGERTGGNPPTNDQQIAYLTPEKIHLFRLKPVMRIPLYFSETTNYFIQALQYKNFLHTGNSTKLIGNTGINRVTITGVDPFTIADSGISTELEDAMDAGNFKIGDVFKDVTNSKYGIITDIDYVADNITVEGGDIKEDLIGVEWAIHESYDRIDKFGSFACACPWSGHSLLDRIESDFIQSQRYMGYYGRDGSLSGYARINMDIKDYSDLMFVPGRLNNEILLESDGIDHVKKIVIADIGESIRFQFNQVIGFTGEGDIDNDDALFMFLKNCAPKKLHIDGIDIISYYIESPYLLSLVTSNNLRKIWTEEGTGEIYFGVNEGISAGLVADIGSEDISIELTNVTNFPTEGNVFIDGEKIHYTGISVVTLTGITRGVINRSHVLGSDVYLVQNLLLRPTLLGSLTSDMAIDETDNIEVAKSEYFTLPDNAPYDGVGNGYISIDNEIIEVDWGAYAGSYNFTITAIAISRGKRGTEAEAHSEGSPVYIFDTLLAGDLMRSSGYNVDYSGDYKAKITIGRTGNNELDASGSLRIYVVRAKWNL